MSPRIKILPENLTNKIAAGEVVERPASVVKELVENALDAGCSEVIVEIEAGGRRLIRITDDGCGMSREDALLAIERHATSKIASDDDLFALSTLGFRGEALPSIASVSRFTLASRERGAIEGTEIYAEGGRIKEVKACGMAEGTVLTVRNLFFNTPARLKFMKSAETEAGHVGDFLTRLAVSRPDVRFTYLNDGRTVFRALSGTLGERVAALLGRSLATALYPLELSAEGVTVRGLVASPDTSRSGPSHLYTYINGRFIRDRVVQHAIMQAYRNFLERGRYPVVVLFIEVPPGEVDVNVHPTKHEVRFRQQSIVHDVIEGAVSEALRPTPWLRQNPATAVPASAPPPRPTAGPAAERVAEVRELLVSYRPAPAPSRPLFSPPPAPLSAPVSTPLPAEAVPPEPEGERGFFSSLAVIGQYNASYILCQDGADLVIIDQHAAHERVAFERLKARYRAGGVEGQGLLFPETLELSHREAAVAREYREELDRIGFELEDFGGTTWVVKGVPRVLAGRDCLRILRDTLEELQSIGTSRSVTEVVEELLTRIACHSVVRGEHSLTAGEITALFVQMDATDFSTNCPHGRPVLQRLTLAEVERMFRRT
ncbi:DNA mismatch repair endonuclease MutL [Geobacter pickeringii]|uniref:DNA mismatch repair protein MutL n=1 Tax=Geobacter pickeringii TaxID=345632 RepID=A0A0B5BEB9_9BACT|nr:DNA mismatch repair endonuclease MutL [Geobacter pickeringii]AJE03499.1 DNA mismatch repair protein MutL [Geobacter pickeringii]